MKRSAESPPQSPPMPGPDTRRDFLAGRALLRLADRPSEIAPQRSAPTAGPTVRLETRAMACPWSVVLNPGPPEQVMAASDALDLVHPIEQLLSIYRDDSPISQLKTLQPGESRALPSEVIQLLIQCRELAEHTSGAFDPTSGPVIRLWRECRQAGRIPEPAEIDQALTRCGIARLIELDAQESTIRVQTPGVEIDLGSIGKGYAIDRIAEALRGENSKSEIRNSNAEGEFEAAIHSSDPVPSPVSNFEFRASNFPLSNFLLHGGFSSLLAHGHHNGHPGWPVGLRHPLFPDRNYATLLLKDRALSTSGSNVQFFRHQGERYGHILDPRTGWPVQGMLSVTVTAPTATAADALSTAFYVMGLAVAAAYCHQHPEIGAILVPPLTSGRTLAPLILNISEEDLFFEDDLAVSG